MTFEFRDHTITLDAGELCVVPRSLEHRTVAVAEVEVLVLETAGMRNTGNIIDEQFTAPKVATI